MRSIQRRYLQIKKRNPYYSDYLCFCEAIKKQKFSPQIITRWFNKLVDKNDYSSDSKKDIIKHLLAFSNLPEDDQKSTINDPLNNLINPINK